MKFLLDFFPILLFFIAYQVWDIYVATAVAVVAAALQVGWQRLRHGRVEKMQAVTLALLVVFGGLTLLLHDPVFIKWKPTVVNWLFAVAFLVSAYVGERSLLQRMMGHAVTLPEPIWRRLNWAWVVFFAAMGVANIVVAYQFSEEVWVNFKLFGLLGLTLLFVLAQAPYLAKHMEPEETPAKEET
jgi:intracellular septation protein